VWQAIAEYNGIQDAIRSNTLGNRLSKIYTRTGDDGSTGLGDGSRIAKDSARVEAYGTVDELNSALGVLLASPVDTRHARLLSGIQQCLFDLGGELSIPSSITIDAQDVTALEQALDAYNENLEPLKDFIMPGGSTAAAACHIARTVCRRAERRLCTLAENDEINAESVRYLNRLSDLLFVLARVLNQEAQSKEILWTPKAERKT